MEQIFAPNPPHGCRTATDRVPGELSATVKPTAAAVLLSVVDAAEAALVAAEVPEALIDIKDPSAGSLGRPATAKLTATIAALPNSVLSVATGDIDQAWLPLPVTYHTPAIAMLKFGVQRRVDCDFVQVAEILRSGEACRGEKSAPSEVPSLRRWVACFYVDIDDDGRLRCKETFVSHQPTIERELCRFVERWRAAGGRRVLIDTAVKNGRSSLDYIGAEELGRLFRSTAPFGGCEWMLAGSLRLEDWETVAACGASVIGFRSAICRDRARQGAIDRSKLQTVRKWSVGPVGVGLGGR